MTILQILSKLELTSFESPPVLTSRERKKYFTFPPGILKRAQKLTPQNKIRFLVMYGYFKATNKFYVRQFHQKDVDFVATRMNIKIDIGTEYNKRTYMNHKEAILAYCGCKKFTPAAIRSLLTQLAPLIRSHTRPKTILYQSCELLAKQKIEIPNYLTLATIITKELNRHQKELAQMLYSLLTEKQTYGSPIFKAVPKKRCKALYRALKKSPKSPELAVGAGSEPSYVDRSVGAP